MSLAAANATSVVRHHDHELVLNRGRCFDEISRRRKIMKSRFVIERKPQTLYNQCKK